jgi:hypothetical protein
MSNSVINSPLRAARTAVGLVVFLVSACTSSTAPTQIDGVVARSTHGHLTIANRTDSPVFLFVIGRETVNVIDWIPCTDAVRCPPLAPGASVTQPNPRRTDTSREKEAVVYWWHVVPSQGGFRADQIRSGVVKLDW